MWRFVIGLFIILEGTKAFAFIEPYLMSGEAEQRSVNGPQWIDAEYYSDILAYRHSLRSQSRFLNSKNAFDMYVGSISSAKFATQKRLKLNQDLNSKLQFDLIYVELNNFEIERQQLAMGLTYKISSFLGVSAYTSLFMNKEQDDVGVATNIELSDRHSLRLFLNFVDFDFNKRNQEEAKDQKRPLHFGLLGTFLADHEQFFEYYAFHNSPITRDYLSTQDLRYVFKETRLGLRGRKSLPSKTLDVSKYNFNWDAEFFVAEEGQFLISTVDPSTDRNWQKYGYRVLTQIENQEWIWGLEYNHRNWRSVLGDIAHDNWMPHIWYQMKLRKKYLPNQLDLGLESSIHQGSGPKELRSSTDEDRAVHSRMNLRLHYNFGETANLNFLLSLDLDDPSWEGGGAQFQLLF